MNERRTELYVGFFLCAGLPLWGGIIPRFGSSTEYFREKYALIVYFPETDGLLENSEVRPGGARIGQVARKPYLRREGSGIVTEIEIYDAFRIPEGSEFSIRVSGLLGDSYVAIKAPVALDGRFVIANSQIKGSPARGLETLATSANDLSLKGQEMLDGMRNSLPELKGALAKFDRIILGEENRSRFNEAVAQPSKAVTALNEKVLADENTANLRLALAELRETTGNLKDAGRKLGPGLDSFRAVAEKANLTLDVATEGSGLLASLLTGDQLGDDFRNLIRNLRENGVLRYKDIVGNESPTDVGTDRKRGLFRKT